MATVDLDHTAIQELFRDPAGPVGRAIERASYAVENQAKALVLMPGSGRVYTTRFFTDHSGVVHPIGHRPPHQASAPGEPPASDTGRLLSSIGHEIRVEDTVVGVVSAPGRIPVYLELGTAKMAPRPFLRPALDILKAGF